MTTLWCLHGNLQLPSAWQFLEGQLGDDIKLELINLWESQADGFWPWAESFCEKVNSSESSRNVLLAYSMGGRLALHAILKQPDLWQSAIIIAADTGLSSMKDRKKRLAWDQAWGERFLKDDWHTVLNDWDAQGVFASRSNTPARNEADFSKKAIARFFDVFSKGRQDDLLEPLSALVKPPVLFLSGEEDLKFTAVGSSLTKTCSNIQHRIISNAAHRVPWENQQAFLKSLKQFLAQTRGG